MTREDLQTALTAAQSRVEELGRERDILRGVMEMVRCYPDFDHGGPFPQMMDEALNGETPGLLMSVHELRAAVKPTMKHEHKWVRIDAYDALTAKAESAERAAEEMRHGFVFATAALLRQGYFDGPDHERVMSAIKSVPMPDNQTVAETMDKAFAALTPEKP